VKLSPVLVSSFIRYPPPLPAPVTLVHSPLNDVRLASELSTVVLFCASSALEPLMEFQVTVFSVQGAVTRYAPISTFAASVVCVWSNQVRSCAESSVVPGGIRDRSNFSRLRAVELGVLPTDSRQLPSKFTAGSSEVIIASCDCVTVGWIFTVGSTTTGYCRAASFSHAASGVIVTTDRSPRLVSVCVTRSVDVLPYGPRASFLASYMNGFGR
jgi:hypothetical protein